MTAAFAGEPAATSGHVVTLVMGSTFCISGRTGDIDPRATQGLFFRDTRVLSGWRLLLDGLQPQVLGVSSPEPFRALFVSRLPPLGAATEVLLERHRYVGEGLREDLRLRNLGAAARRIRVDLAVTSDLADLFAVKEGRLPDPPVALPGSADGSAVTVENEQGRGVRVDAPGAVASATGLRFDVELPARGEWSTTVLVSPLVDGAAVAVSFPPAHPPEQATPDRRPSAWRSGSPRVDSAHAGLLRTLQRSLDDLGALRIFDPKDSDRVAVAAGAPWFMALFGRDSLLTSLFALPLDPTTALGTLQTLAAAQGDRHDERTEEQPGRILHETRLGTDFPLSRGGGSIYYGTADATPLFVVLLGELARWGARPDAVRALLQHADRALDWVELYGDRDGDGFVEYERATTSGLRNQGWKDSHDGVNFADGRLAEPPVALCEVQAYAYAAYLARARLAEDAGDDATAARCAAAAAARKAAFNERFWLPDRGWYAVALDHDKSPVDALTSNLGHCLWSGIVDDDKAAAVAAHLVSPALFSGWGVRTLATTMAAYNPMSYHNGSVWPHDSAIAAAGLMRYGFVEEATAVATAVLDAAEAFDGRLPELLCGFDRQEYPSPLPFPTSCSPQAWASAAPLLLLRTLMRLEPDVPRGRVWFDPVWPARYGRLAVRRLAIGSRSVALLIDDEDEPVLAGLDDDTEVVRGPYPTERVER